jgi:protocatechuate 3,4-dioxygenase beta subunit
MQKGDSMSLRAQFRTDKEGNYRFWSIKPTFYPVPGDGPVGGMLRRMGRHPNRPGHMHMMLQAPGHERLITHIFVKDSPYLDSDAVFGVRNSLVVDFPKHAAGQGAGRPHDEQAVLHGEVRLQAGAVVPSSRRRRDPAQRARRAAALLQSGSPGFPPTRE